MDLTFYIDIAVIVLIGISALAGFTRGFIRELFSIGIWILSGIGAWFLSSIVAGKLKKIAINSWGEDKLSIFGDERYFDMFLRIAAGILIVVILLFILQIIFSIFINNFKVDTLRPVDKVLGLAFGAFKALLVCGAIWYIIEDKMQIADRNPENAIQNYVVEYSEHSKMIPFIRIGKAFVSPFLNPIMSMIASGVDTLQERPSDAAPNEATNMAITPSINQQQEQQEPAAEDANAPSLLDVIQ